MNSELKAKILTFLKSVNYERLLMVSIIFLSTFGCFFGVICGRIFIYDSEVNNQTENLIQARYLCDTVYTLPSPFSQVKLVSTFLSLFIIFISILIPTKREWYLKKCSKPSFPGLQNPFIKVNRLNTTLTYSLIAYQVLEVTLSKFQSHDALDLSMDPTGLLIFFIQVVDIVIIGIRYYPILMAFSRKSIPINILTGLYIYIDLGFHIYYESVCETTFTRYSLILTYSKNSVFIYLSIICFYLLPNILFCSYLATTLIIDAVRDIIYLAKKERQVIIIDNKITEFDVLTKMADENELFFSSSDFKYVRGLLKSQKYMLHDQEVTTTVNNTYWYKFKCFIFENFKKYIYDPNSHFKFTLRFLCTQVICIFIIYCLLLTIFMLEFGILEDAIFFDSNTTDNTGSSLTGVVFCKVKFVVGLCNDKGEIFGIPPGHEINIYFALWTVLLFSLFFTFFVCIFQIILGIHNYKRDFMMLYRGKSEFIKSRDFISKTDIGVIMIKIFLNTVNA